MTQLNPPVNRDLLLAVLDRLVPGEGNFPSAGSILLEFVDDRLVADPRSVAMLQRVDALAHERRGAAFAALAEEQQVALLQEVEAAETAAFNALLAHVYSGYYSHPAVIQALGLPPGPPAKRPHHLEPLAPARLDAVARRGPIYRPA